MRARALVMALLLAAPLSAQAPPRDTVVIRVPAGVALVVRDSIRVQVDTVWDTVFVSVPDTTPEPPDSTPEPPDTTTPPPPGTGFYSDFSTCLGTALPCKSDGARWAIALSQDQHNVGEVVPGTEAGFPSVNALRITPNASQSALRLTNLTLGPLPENTSRFHRFYFRLDHRRIGDSNNHPIETSTQLSGTIAWAFRSNALTDSTWTAQMRISSSVVYESPALQTHTPYLVEFQLERLSGMSFRLHMRVHDMAGTLVAGDAQWRLVNGSGTLADNPTLQFASDAGLPGWQVGLNGISNTDWHPSILFGYQGAFCVRSDTWCGPYVAGEGR